MLTSDTGKEAKRRKVSPEDLAALQERAAAWPHVGGITREGMRKRAVLVFELYLDFLRAGVLGTDFPRWLSRHSGISYKTCWRYMKAGERLDVACRPNRNLTGLVAEQMEAQRTPGPELDWDSED